MARNGALVPLLGHTVCMYLASPASSDLAPTLAAIAAFVAAGLSFVGVVVNVSLSARLASRGKLDEWRRSQVMPIVVRMLSLSQDAENEWQYAADAGETSREQAMEHWTKGGDLCSKMRYEVDLVRLAAGEEVRAAARVVYDLHVRVYGEMGKKLQSGGDFSGDFLAGLAAVRRNLGAQLEGMVVAVRTDLGMDRRGRPVLRFSSQVAVRQAQQRAIQQDVTRADRLPLVGMWLRAWRLSHGSRRRVLQANPDQDRGDEAPSG
jgi:hypothetical protein